MVYHQAGRGDGSVSGYICAVCGEVNWSGNETEIAFSRTELNEHHAVTTYRWKAQICDACLKKYFDFQPMVLNVRRDDVEEISKYYQPSVNQLAGGADDSC